jgi:hypothetical protein
MFGFTPHSLRVCLLFVIFWSSFFVSWTVNSYNTNMCYEISHIPENQTEQFSEMNVQASWYKIWKTYYHKMILLEQNHTGILSLPRVQLRSLYWASKLYCAWKIAKNTLQNQNLEINFQILFSATQYPQSSS